MFRTTRLAFCGMLIFLLAAASPNSNEKSNVFVEEAWKAWGENNQQQVEAKFTAALKEDLANVRASLGLYLLYEMQGKKREAWTALKSILQAKDKSSPYLFAGRLSSDLNNYLADPQSGALALAEALSTGTASADPDGILKAMANEELAGYYELRGDQAKAARYYQSLNAVKDWMIIGPFENVSASGIENVFPPEAEFAPTQSYVAKNGIPARWFSPAAIKPDYWLEFTRYFPARDAVFYANTFVFSPKKQSAQLRVGTSGSVKVFLNDQQLFESLDENNNDLDTYIIETELQEGWNRVLIKSGFSEINRCNFMLRLTDRGGEPIKDLQISTEARNYARRPNAPVKLVENFAEAFFKARIKEQPEQLENYAMLAKAYLRNDKASEGELVLRDAIKRTPRCALFQTLLLDAFGRGEKRDEIPTTQELIYSLDKNIPGTLVYRIDDFLEKSEFDKAEELIKEYEKLRPDSEELFEIKLNFYGKKDQDEKVKEVLQKALRLYPMNWTFVYTDALISVEVTGKHVRAISAMEKYLAKEYSYTALTTLAGFHLQASDTKKWLETYNKVLELDPASPNTQFQIADVYFKRQDYTQAEKTIRKALALCPGCSAYWSKLGEIHRVRKEIEPAKQDYREALKYNPLDYEARRVLRELEGKPSIFSLFESAEIKKLIAQAPDDKAYPESGGVILLQDTKRVVYEEGASESAVEVLIKVFNKRGIDDFKEYWIALNGYTQTLVVEKAIVIKPNGNEIPADVQSNHAVFKTLEENDTIYLKWSIKNYNSGKLFSDFWDTAHFNSFYPSKLIRYSLLVPQNYQFRASAQNMPAEAVKKQTDAGVIHQWAVQDEPAIEIEAGMPMLEDIGKIIYISSIKDWDSMVSWYADLSRAKTRSSWEIKEQVEKLVGGKKEMTEDEKIEAIYNFITENIRYSSVPFRQSGLVPQKARDVLVNKIGDCKDVATLCVTMLRELGITGYHVLLNTRDAGQYREALPAILFNHCIVAVETRNGLRYLDLTAHNLPADSLPELDREALSLVIKPGVKAATLLPVEKLAPRQVIHRTNVEIKDDMGAQFQYISDWQGAAAAYPRMIFRYKGPKEREKLLSDALGAVFPGAKLSQVEFDGLDAPKSLSRIGYRVSAPSYLSEAGQFKLLKLHWADKLSSRPAPAQEKRKFDYYYWPYADRVEERIEIRLPAGYEPLELAKDVKLTSAIADYSLRFTYANGVITGQREMVNKKAIVSPQEYVEFKQFYNRVVKEDDRSILLKSSQ